MHINIRISKYSARMRCVDAYGEQETNGWKRREEGLDDR